MTHNITKLIFTNHKQEEDHAQKLWNAEKENAASKDTLKLTVAPVHRVPQTRDPARRQVIVEGGRVASVAGLEAAVPGSLSLKPAVEMNHQFFISISSRSKSTKYGRHERCPTVQ